MTVFTVLFLLGLGLVNAIVAKVRGDTGWVAFVPGAAVYKLVKEKFFNK